jgi:HK97 family phage portal protein
MELIRLNIPRPDNIRMSGPTTFADPSAEFIQSLIGFPAAAGKPVTRISAVRIAAFLAAAKMLANDIAKMPLILRETQTVNGRQRTQPAVENPLYSLLKDVPNPWHTSYQLRFFLAFQLVTNCNCFCQIVRDQAGDIIALVPLDAWSMAPEWDRSTKPFPTLSWKYSDSGNTRTFQQSEVWHATNTNIDGNGIQGTAIIALAKEALSVLMAAEETAGRMHANGLAMGGFITTPENAEITEPQAQNIVDRLKKDFAGSQNAGKFTFLPGGAKWEKMTFNAQESQLLESRKWNEQEVVRLLGGAPLLVKLGMGEQNSTYAASSAFLDEYFNTSLLPLTTAIEQSITRDLIDKTDRGKLFAKHNADIILRGSPKERAETNKTLIESGQLTFNEARAIEDRDYVEGGDALTLPANSCIFDIAEQEWFIPGQQVPEASEGEAPTAKPGEQEPDAAGSGDGDTAPPVKTKPQPKKAETRLLAIANGLAERVMRKEAKGGIDAKFVAEVMNISKDKAEEYVAKRSSLSDEEARAALIALAQGE